MTRFWRFMDWIETVLLPLALVSICIMSLTLAAAGIYLLITGGIPCGPVIGS